MFDSLFPDESQFNSDGFRQHILDASAFRLMCRYQEMILTNRYRIFLSPRYSSNSAAGEGGRCQGRFRNRCTVISSFAKASSDELVASPKKRCRSSSDAPRTQVAVTNTRTRKSNRTKCLCGIGVKSPKHGFVWKLPSPRSIEDETTTRQVASIFTLKAGST